MGLELIKATVINIYKTLAITGYPLSWPSKLIMSAAQHSLFCTLGPFGSLCGEGSAPAITTPRALRQVPTRIMVAVGSRLTGLIFWPVDSLNNGILEKGGNRCTKLSNPRQSPPLGNMELPQAQEDDLRFPLTVPCLSTAHGSCLSGSG